MEEKTKSAKTEEYNGSLIVYTTPRKTEEEIQADRDAIDEHMKRIREEIEEKFRATHRVSGFRLFRRKR